MNLLKEKNRLLNKKIFTQSWDICMKHIRNNKFKTNLNNLLTEFAKYSTSVNIITLGDTRELVNAFMIVYRKSDVIEQNDTNSEFLFYKSRELVDKFDNITTLNEPDITLFFVCFKEYKKIVKAWREGDLPKFIDNYVVPEYIGSKNLLESISNKKEKSEADIQYTQATLNHKANIERKISNLSNSSLQYLHGTPPMSSQNLLKIRVNEKMKKTFWDMFEETVNKEDYSPIVDRLKEFKDMYYDIVPKRRGKEIGDEMKTDFEDNMDIDIIVQMIEGGNMKPEEIFNIIKGLTARIQKIQAFAEDKDTERMLENVYSMFNHEEKLGKILRYFFQNIFHKMDAIKLARDIVFNDFNLDKD